MSREVRHDGAGAFQVRFPFDRHLVELVKSLPDRRWNAAGRYWWVPEEAAITLVELLLPERFAFDPATRSLYRALGGTHPIADEAPDSAEPRQAGLFDAELPSPSPGPAVDEAGDYSVSELNEQVRRALERAFPASVWLVGEISGFNRNAHKRHVGFKLVEHDADGRSVSSVDATLFEREREAIERTLRREGEPFRLEDEVSVRVRARVELYVPWGSYRVIVEDVDVSFTLGEAARRREEIVRRLTEEGLVGRNTALVLPTWPLRVALITSLGSDAHRDVMRTLEESGFAFEVVAHGARVQGRATEPSVLNALDHFRRRAGELDVVMICRGGGSRTDLAWFDSEKLGRAVAEFPIPVIVGIGHEQDHSVLDAVGWRMKTPTAAAAFVVDAIRLGMETLENRALAVLERAVRRISEARERDRRQGRRLVLGARAQLDRERTRLAHIRVRAQNAARARLATERERVARRVADLPRAAVARLATGRAAIDAAGRGVARAAKRDLADAAARVWRLVDRLASTTPRCIDRERERLEARGHRLELSDPRRVVERGYAILRLADRSVIATANAAPEGTAVRAELRDGELALRSEGRAEREESQR